MTAQIVDMERVRAQLREYSFPVDVHEKAHLIFAKAERLRDVSISYSDAQGLLKEIVDVSAQLIGAASCELRRVK